VYQHHSKRPGSNYLTFCSKCDFQSKLTLRLTTAAMHEVLTSQNLQDLPKNYIAANLIASLPANNQCDKTVYCEIHSNKKVKFYCETCQRFACSTCTGVKCRQHTVLELPDADVRFKLELNVMLTPLEKVTSNFDRAIKDAGSDITHISSHFETLQNDVDKLLSQTETKLKALFDQLLAKLKQCKDTAKLTISKLHSEHVDKLKTSLADTQKRSHTNACIN
jgi:hypothetical protein